MCAKGNLLAGLKASSPFGRCPTLYPGSSATAIYIAYEKTLGTRSRSDQVSFKVTLEQYAKGNTRFRRSLTVRFASPFRNGGLARRRNHQTEVIMADASSLLHVVLKPSEI